MKVSSSLILSLVLIFGPSLGHAQFGGIDLNAAASLRKSESPQIQVPNLKESSVGDLWKIALQALGGLGSLAEQASPKTGRLINSTKQAIQSNDTLGALKSLSSIAEAVKSIPGVDGLLGTSQQLVGAWALKQGFSPSMISGVMSALQTRDVADLGVQATQLLSNGRLNQEQTTLLKACSRPLGSTTPMPERPLGKLKVCSVVKQHHSPHA